MDDTCTICGGGSNHPSIQEVSKQNIFERLQDLALILEIGRLQDKGNKFKISASVYGSWLSLLQRETS